jgi:hypothetical protein
MKYSKLEQIVYERVNQLKQNAAYSGEWGDGGSESLSNRLKDFQQNLIVKLDLRPSEFNKLNDIEVGEPIEFSDIIEKYKINLVMNIKL